MNMLCMSKYIYLRYWMKTIKWHQEIVSEIFIHTISHSHGLFTNILSLHRLIISVGLSQYGVSPSIPVGIYNMYKLRNNISS